MNDTALAEDLVQDTYLRAWEAFDSLVDEAQVCGWLVRILQRMTSDHYRTNLRRQTLLPVTRLEDEHREILASEEQGPLEALISRCAGERVEHAFNFPGSSCRPWSYTTSRGSNTARWPRSWRSPSARS